ncbi:MAG: protein TolR [Paracoccaceae bacterium]
MAGGMSPRETAGRPGARLARARRTARPLSEINVTPFVDVMLVLLVIFMVTAPLLTVGVPLELPETEARPLPTAQEEPLVVTLDGAGQVFIQETPVAPETLVPRLAAILEARAAGRSEQVYLRADRTLGYGRVMEVMGRLNAAGVTRIALVTGQAREAE